VTPPPSRGGGANQRRPSLARTLLASLLLLAAAPASAAEWRDYQIIEWQPRTPPELAALKRIGVTAAMVLADRDGTGTPLPQQTAPLQAAGLRWYVENIATDLYSQYHRWTPGKPVNWRFVDVQRRYQADPSDRSALMRDPSLSDPAAQERIDARLTEVVRQQQEYQPLYYSLGDETGVADLAAFWDFDFSPDSLAGMRTWLRRQYPSLAALNAEWGTRYATWDAVQPETTRAAMQRHDGNFAAWADFKAWMDVAFARALRSGTDAVHRADPHALAAIEGAQIPGWGGYDYTRLAHAVDLMEVYDLGENLPILRSFNPRLIALSTAFGATPEDLHGIWRELLRGTRGLVLWDDDHSIVAADGTLGARGQAYAPLFAELRRIAPLLFASTPRTDPVAILYSPASFRTQWMLDQQPQGDAWMQRSAEKENEDNAFRVALHDYAEALSGLGLQPHFVSPAMLARLSGDKVLILPDTLALSPADGRAIAAFAARGGVVIADTPPGRYDAHSKRLPRPAVPVASVHLIAASDTAALAAAIRRAGVAPLVAIDAPATGVETHIFSHGSTMIYALQRRTPGGAAAPVTLTLPGGSAVRDLRTGQGLRTTPDPGVARAPGASRQVTVMLDPVAPTILTWEHR
jgi:hypothetical protein